MQRTVQNIRSHTIAIALVMAGASVTPAMARTCDGLTAVPVSPLGGTATVTLAALVSAGAFTPPAGIPDGPPGTANQYAALPAFCRVAITLHPTPGSTIHAEVWLPSSGWTGKLQVVGNGGFAGTIGYRAMATAVAAGYAAASTDTGHARPDANTFATADATIDFAYRAVHETAVAAKKVVDGFFGAAPKLSY